MLSPAKLENEKLTDYSYLMADGRSREFIWGKMAYTNCCVIEWA